MNFTNKANLIKILGMAATVIGMGATLLLSLIHI